MSTRTPVYFLSHGGPNILFDKEHPAYKTLEDIGREITQKVNPKAIVAFSAHWQSESNMIEVNTAEDTNLIYDFYGFPSEYYKAKYPNKGSKEIAEKVLKSLSNAGIMAKPTKRGLDHGIWVCFRIAFDPEKNPLNVPIVQVSLFGSEDPYSHYALGRAIESLREENIAIIVSGMAVHNLRDLRFAMMEGSGPFPYVKPFDEALREAAEAPVEAREKKMADLLTTKLARQAHPSFEHVLPLHIGAGAAGSDLGKRLWTLPEMSMSWAQYRFGEVPSSA
ncbi:Extradiol ring-cleavage dioxygenase, class III enzyme, subunit B [Xylogone sp. PMI_703]|nr:Extradiol ring-cleavage dioxygenase, class III enzyme, subunit B [Xylogone sp. PMI_703]